MRVLWSAAARADLEAALDYLERHNDVAAEALAEEVLDASETLATLAHRGKPGRVHGTRELLTHRPYVLVYRVEAEKVRVLRLWCAAVTR